MVPPYSKSLHIIKKLNASFYLNDTLFDFGFLYETKGDLNKAKDYYRQAYNNYQEINK